MLRLPSAEPTWLDLAQGVRVLHRPASPAEFSAANHWAAGRVAAAEAALVERLGMAELPEADRRNVHAGYLVAALARLCIRDWSGVEGPCTAEGLESLMQVSGMAEAYLPAAMALVMAVATEGNGCAPAPNGTMAGAPNTAGDAELAA
jgi:hypothetical protein